MSDDGAFQDKILKVLENTIIQDPQLLSFSIVPKEENLQNSSPVLYESHHIALESWCVKHIYKYAYSELLDTRLRMQSRKLPLFKAGPLNHLLVGALLMNPEVTTLWAMKRELVDSGVLKIENELFFAKIVLTHKSKSFEALSYRRWLVKKLINRSDEWEYLRDVYLNEIAAINIAAENEANNYHAWSHRIWCVENIIVTRLPDVAIRHFLGEEIDFSLKWIEQHVSEHSGYHYRQFMIDLFKSEVHFQFYLDFNKVTQRLGIIDISEMDEFIPFLFGCKKRNDLNSKDVNGLLNYLILIFHDLLFTCKRLNILYPGHESLWYYRRYLLQSLVNTFNEYNGIKPAARIGKMSFNQMMSESNNETGEKKAKIFKSNISELENSRLYEILVREETDFIADNCCLKNNAAVQIEYAKRHEKWLKFVLGFEKI